MMHLVSFTVNPPRPMPELWAALQASPSWAHPFDNTWLIVSDETAVQLWTRLVPTVQTTDSVLITEITKESDVPMGWLPASMWEWVNGWKTDQSKSTYKRAKHPECPRCTC